jgi:hypothetical protein
MPNDIMGSYDLFDIKGRLFHFYPLRDLDFSALDAWVSWRLEKRSEAISVDGFSELRTVQGIAQILYWSVHRDCLDTVIQLAEFIGSEWNSDCDSIWDKWYKLNFEEGDHSTIELPELDEKQEKPNNSNALYTQLAYLYKWTSRQIAELTPYQQLVYVTRGRQRKKTLQFATEEEYQKWMIAKKHGQ